MASSVQKIAPVRGKLGVLLPGMGAVSSTLIAGVELYKKGLGDLVGSITQLQTIRLGKRYEGRRPLIRNFAPIDKPENIVFGGWDIFPDDMHQAAIKAGVLPADRLEPIKKELAAIKPFTGVFDPKYIKNLKGWPYYMIEAFDTQPEAEKQIIAGMHPMDLTVRPQLVNELNPTYRDVIREFRNLTGVGAVLNTSFNLHGFPIVGTPEVAIDTLKKSQLDALALGPFLVMRGDRNGSSAEG